jgi:uncharacterized membrane protein YGL010W
MAAHLFRLVLRQYLEHKNKANLRVHVVSNGVLWTALVTVLSQVPLPLPGPRSFANLGALFALGSAVYWLALDRLVPVLVLAWTAVWPLCPFAPWGPGHGWLGGVVVPLGVLVAAGLSALAAHMYYDEHAPRLNDDSPRAEALGTTHAVVFGAFHFWLCALLTRGYRAELAAELDAAEQRWLAPREHSAGGSRPG